jgi:ornithine decarboxylase
VNQIKKWNYYIPWIKPYYAIKANNSVQILDTLFNNELQLQNKIGLDVASIQEFELASNYVNKENIIYTNPHTIPHEKDIITNIFSKINVKIVDSLCEIQKLIKYGIKTDILIRTKSNIESANVKFDSKFGCSIEEGFEIIKYAEKNNFKIKGISFHIGSGGNFVRKEAYKIAFEYAKPLLTYIEDIYKNQTEKEKEKLILDIGGGLLYDSDLEDSLGWTRELSEKYIIIAEPGRYYAEPSYHLATQIIAKTERGVYLDNGIYHEFNVYHRDHWHFPKLTHYYDTTKETIEEVKEWSEIKVFGPTCDSYDNIDTNEFPNNFEVDDWIFLNNMGAYTSAAKVDFNGITSASNTVCLL